MRSLFDPTRIRFACSRRVNGRPRQHAGKPCGVQIAGVQPAVLAVVERSGVRPARCCPQIVVVLCVAPETKPKGVARASAIPAGRPMTFRATVSSSQHGGDFRRSPRLGSPRQAIVLAAQRPLELSRRTTSSSATRGELTPPSRFRSSPWIRGAPDRGSSLRPAGESEAGATLSPRREPHCSQQWRIPGIRAERFHPRFNPQPGHAVGAILQAFAKPLVGSVLISEAHIRGADFVRAEIPVFGAFLHRLDQPFSLLFWPATACTWAPNARIVELLSSCAAFCKLLIAS